MSTHCKGICDRIKMRVESRLVKKLGGRWCKKCCVFIKWDGLYCPCCRTKLPLSINTQRKVYL